MICFPNAKINLGLHVTGKRPDGYHTIESIFYPIPMKDALELVISKKTSFTQTGLQLGITPKDNLVMRAYALMTKKYKIPSLDIFLKKAIPSGAGLGGGSADAAFMLKLLQAHPSLRESKEKLRFPNMLKMTSLENSSLVEGTTKQSIEDIPESELLKMAESLGADCPFFIRNTPALVTGTGNEFQPSGISLKGYILYIVKPLISISTQEAYSMIKPQKPAFSFNELSSIPVFEWKHVLKNDFEPGIFKKFPSIEKIKDNLYAMGAEYASMSGSGSAVYGLFKKDTISPTFADCFTWKGILE